jgi:hypothetical protein
MTEPQPPAAPQPLLAAQTEMRFAYLGGGAGMLVSAFMWLAAGLTAAFHSPRTAVWVLLAGGVFIHPLSILLLRALKRPGRHDGANPLGRLAIETTAWMILGMLVCLGVALLRQDLFFPAMLLIIGGRYLTFATLYGDRIYWLVGGVLAISGWVLAASGAVPSAGALTGAAIETMFAVVIMVRARATTSATS